MQRRINPELDIVKDILEAVLKDQPGSSFTQSLYQQYIERGGLSKRQLQGLFGKAQKVKDIPAGKLATLEAIILRKQEKSKKTEVVSAGTLHVKDEAAGKMIDALLAKYPQHKRVLFFKTKFDNNESLSAIEKTELEKFTKLLLK
jgi:hypothetical protein